MYKLQPNTFMGNPAQTVQRLLDGAYIPFDPNNVDYQDYLKWLDEGNTPESADVIVP